MKPTVVRGLEKMPQKDEIDFYNDFWLNYQSPLMTTLFNYHYLCRYRSILRIIKKTAIKNPSILEIGCGTGLLTRKLVRLSSQILGIDYSPKAIEIAQQINAKIPFEVVDFTNDEDIKLKIKTKYQIIVASEVLEHIADKSEFFRKAHRVLTDDGFLIITTPNKEVLNKYNIQGDQFREEFQSFEDITNLVNGLFEIIYQGSTYFIKPTRNIISRQILNFIKIRLFRQILNKGKEGFYMVFLFRKI